MTWDIVDKIRALTRTLFVPHGDHGPDHLADAVDLHVPPVSERGFRCDPGGWFVDEAGDGSRLVRVPTERTTRLASVDANHDPAPAIVVWHWTATARGTAKRLAESIRKLPANGQRAASWSALIAANGTVWQSAPTTVGTWHAGGASAAKFRRRLLTLKDATFTTRDAWNIENGANTSANAISFGIELENVGEVRLVNGRWMGWPFGKDGTDGPIVPTEQVTKLHGRYYQDLTAEQVAACGRVLRAVVRRHPHLTREACSWTHAKIDPSRKTDPGPVFVERYLQGILDHAFGP